MLWLTGAVWSIQSILHVLDRELWVFFAEAKNAANKRWERTHDKKASLLSCVGEQLKRNVRWLC